MHKLGCLREIRDDELELMLSWRNDPEVRKNMYTQHEISLDEHVVWWERISSLANQKYFMFETDATPYGVVGFNHIDSINNNSSWAFYASPTAPKGTGSKMELLALDFAFSELGLHKLNCEVLAFNMPVIKLHQKFGFEVEGVLREQFKSGESFVDVYKLGLLAQEWNDKREIMLDKLIKLTGANDG